MKFTLDRDEYDTDDLTEAQTELLRQCQDLSDARRQLEFKLRQTTGALEYFVGLLRQSLVDSAPTS